MPGAVNPPSLYDRINTGAGIFRCSLNGTGVENVAEVTAAIAAAGAYFVSTGFLGVVLLNRRGTRPLAGTIANPYETGTKTFFTVLSGVRVIVENGCRLRAADGTQTGVTDYLYMFVFQDVSNVVFEGDGELDLNSQNQPGYSGGYEQNRGGHVRGYTASAGAAGLHNISVKGLRFFNTFGNPVNMLGNTLNSSQLTIQDSYGSVFGEGFQLGGAVDGAMLDNLELHDYGTSKGDWFEFANTANGIRRRCRAYGHIPNTNTGAYADDQGSTNVATSDGYGYGLNSLYNANPQGGNTPSGNSITGCKFEDCPGTTDGVEGIVVFSRNVYNRCGTGGNGVFNIGTDTSDMRIFDCEFNDCQRPILIAKGIARLYDCRLRGVAAGTAAIFVRRPSGAFATQPTVEMMRGSASCPGGSAVMVDGNGNGVITPVIRMAGCDLRNPNAGEASFAAQNAGSYASLTKQTDVLFYQAVP